MRPSQGLHRSMAQIALIVGIASSSSAVDWQGATPVIIYQAGSTTGAPDALSEDAITKMRASGMSDEVLVPIITSAKAVAISVGFVSRLETQGASKQLVEALRRRLCIAFSILSGPAALKSAQQAGVVWYQTMDGLGGPPLFGEVAGEPVLMVLAGIPGVSPGRSLEALVKGQSRKYPIMPTDPSGRVTQEFGKFQLDGKPACAKGFLQGQEGATLVLLASQTIVGLTPAGTVKPLKFLDLKLGGSVLDDDEIQDRILVGLAPGKALLVSPGVQEAKGKAPTIRPCVVQEGTVAPAQAQDVSITMPEGIAGSLSFSGKASDLAVADVDGDGTRDLVLKYKVKTSPPEHINLFYVFRADGTLLMIAGSNPPDGDLAPVSGGVGLTLVGKMKGKLEVFQVKPQ